MGYVDQRPFKEFDDLTRSVSELELISPELLNCFESHGFVGLKYEELIKTKGSESGSEIELLNIKQLRVKTMLWAAVAIVRLVALRELLNKAHDRDISILLFKGAALAYQVYNSPEQRPCVDIDIFIDEKQRNDVVKLLSSLGYSVDLVEEPSMICFQFCANKVCESGHVIVLDIHYRINNQAEYEGLFSFSNVLSNSVNLPSIHKYARGLCLEDAYVLACVHLQGHYVLGEQVKGIWVYDIHLLLKAMTSSDKEIVFKINKESSVWQICAFWTQIAHIHFGSDTPMKLQKRLSNFGTNEALLRNKVNPVKLLWDQFCYLPTYSDKVLFLKQLFLPSKQIIKNKYPDSKLFIPVLYLKRAFVGLIKRILKIAM